MSNFHRVMSIMLALSMTGCASGYSKFYKPTPNSTPESIASMRVAPPTQAPIVERSSPQSDAAQVVDAYIKRGYVVIGTSFFNSGRSESESAAYKQAVRVGADLVLIFDPRYTGSTTTTVPITTPTSTTSYSSGTATAYGRGGSVTAYGSGTTTTYGSQTSYVPVTTHRSDHGAVYFVKRRWGFGATWRDLSNEERQELQSNKGVAVRVIVDGSPAYLADVLTGDILLSVNGLPIEGIPSASSLLAKHAGQKVVLSIYRRGQRIEKEVAMQ